MAANGFNRYIFFPSYLDEDDLLNLANSVPSDQESTMKLRQMLTETNIQYAAFAKLVNVYARFPDEPTDMAQCIGDDKKYIDQMVVFVETEDGWYMWNAQEHYLDLGPFDIRKKSLTDDDGSIYEFLVLDGFLFDDTASQAN